MANRKSFCKGLLCTKRDRRFKCVNCGLYICSICTITAIEDKQDRCINCYLKTFSPDWNKLNLEFDEMLKDVFLEKEKKEIPLITKV